MVIRRRTSVRRRPSVQPRGGKHSVRAKTNMTNQLKAQLKFLQNDLKHEKQALARARTFAKYNLPGVTTMVNRHKAGVQKTMRDIVALKKRIKSRQKKGQIFRIL